MIYTILKEDPTLIKITTKDDQNRELQNKAEKHDYEKSIKIENGWYKKKDNLNKKIQVTIREIILSGAGVAVDSIPSTTGASSSFGNPVAGASSFIASVAVLITNNYC